MEKAGWACLPRFAWRRQVAEHVCAEVPHRQFVFTIPKRLRIYFRFDRRLLGQLCLPAEASAQAGRAAARAVITVYRAASDRPDLLARTAQASAVPGMVGAIQTFGQLIHAHPHVHTLMTGGVFLPDLSACGHAQAGGTFLPLPKLATEPFLQLWEQEIFALLLAQGRITEEVVANIALLEALRFQCGPERPLGGGRSARGPAPHPVFPALPL